MVTFRLDEPRFDPRYQKFDPKLLFIIIMLN